MYETVLFSGWAALLLGLIIGHMKKEKAFVYVYPGIGHGASSIEGCPSQMMTAFLEEPAVAPNADCIEAMRR